MSSCTSHQRFGLNPNRQPASPPIHSTENRSAHSKHSRHLPASPILTTNNACKVKSSTGPAADVLPGLRLMVRISKRNRPALPEPPPDSRHDFRRLLKPRRCRCSIWLATLSYDHGLAELPRIRSQRHPPSRDFVIQPFALVVAVTDHVSLVIEPRSVAADLLARLSHRFPVPPNASGMTQAFLPVIFILAAIPPESGIPQIGTGTQPSHVCLRSRCGSFAPRLLFLALKSQGLRTKTQSTSPH